MNRGILVTLAAALILSIPVVNAELSDYPHDDDGWLTRLAGPERLALGDEFGCHGMPDVSILEDPNSVDACISYVNSLIPASRWGNNTLTFGLPTDSSQHSNSAELRNSLLSSGIEAIDNSQFSENFSEFSSFEVNAGSLEKSIASIESIQIASQENGIVIMSWIAEMEDLNVRRDRDVVAWIDEQPFWFTTPGEVISSQTVVEVESFNNTSSVVEVRQPYAESGLWDTPSNSLITTKGINGNSLPVISVKYANESELHELNSTDNHLREGWRFDNGSLHLSLLPNTVVLIDYNSNESIDLVQVIPDTFNGMVPFIVYGLHVVDLFEWSSGFKDSSIRFTWLIEPRPVTQMDWILPVIAGIVGIITIVQMRRLIRTDTPSTELYRNMFESE
ncbi:MAG: hypothetical protein ACJZ49_07560 [Candidatus Thalassarchaeaceae archaeon]|nr:MAG: hypothetical protein CMA04_000495 [Euryarchaeota archaeon]RPG76702.1 MAG: hypothetical protein CBC45_000175 [Euryarchaeota archaeon TMED85]|tara:strand:- start:7830 stop:9002 length:1173 start_codon:yes stop_codon:yes gene_type:complete